MRCYRAVSALLRHRPIPILAALLGAAALLCASAAQAQPTTPGPPVVLDGPSASIRSLGGLDVARDGTGGLVYLKQDGAGTPHVFVSALAGGTFGGPVELDGGLPGASSQPVVAAANGGLLVLAFINAGNLYAVTRPSAFAAFGGPQLLVAGAANPAISATQLGKVYVAFTANGSGGHDVGSAYYYQGAWALDPSPLDANAADDAGGGTSRPSVVAAGDGLGIVAWGENGHIYARRVWGTRSSVAVAQLDPPTFGGLQELTADKPQIGGSGDSSYVDVVYHETFQSGPGTQQSRVLASRLVASQVQGPYAVDAVNGPGAGADDPRIAFTEYGRGFITSARTDTYAVTAVHAFKLGALDTTTSPVNALQEFSAPFAVPGTAGTQSTLIAYQYNPAPVGGADIRVRYADDGATLGPEQVVSAPVAGPADAADGLAAAGDVYGDAAVAFIQGAPGMRSLVVDQFYRAPGGIGGAAPAGFVGGRSTRGYVRVAQPLFSWSPARAGFGPIRYTVTVGGVAIGTTTATSLVPSAPLADGRHNWGVTGVDPAGQSSTMKPATFFLDRLAPKLTLRVQGKLFVGSLLHAVGTVTDTAPPEVPHGSSGIAAVAINLGDGSVVRGVSSRYHAYKRAGRFRITLVAEDRAGNVAVVSRVVRIKPKPKPGPKTKPKGKPKPTVKKKTVRR